MAVPGKVIHKIAIPFGARQMLFQVPLDAAVVYVDVDVDSPQHAGIWYTCTPPEPEPEMENRTEHKDWMLAVVSTTEAFPRVAAHVGSLMFYGVVHHVICLNPSEL